MPTHIRLSILPSEETSRHLQMTTVALTVPKEPESQDSAPRSRHHFGVHVQDLNKSVVEKVKSIPVFFKTVRVKETM